MLACCHNDGVNGKPCCRACGLNFMYHMQPSVDALAKEFDNTRRGHFVRRVMWLDLEDRIRTVLEPVTRSSAAQSFGGLYLKSSFEMNEDKLKNYTVTRTNTTNAIYLFTGNQAPVLLKIYGKSAPEWISDKNAQLWFSQSASGGVSVFMAPYVSELHKFKRDQIWLAHYESPHQVDAKSIAKHAKTFLRYCVDTSYQSPNSFGKALRLRLYSLMDLQYRALGQGRLWVYSRRLIIPIVGAAIVAAIRRWYSW